MVVDGFLQGGHVLRYVQRLTHGPPAGYLHQVLRKWRKSGILLETDINVSYANSNLSLLFVYTG